MQSNMIQQIVVAIFPLLLAITLHEVAHGWMANKLGDPTAKMLGRLTINPIKHIDLFGTIILPLALFWLSGFRFTFGYAKPVPITWQNLRSPRRDCSLVALAGPGANLLMALAWASVIKMVGLPQGDTGVMLFLFYSAQAGILINIVLMTLNLLPIPPLDGSRVVSACLPPRWSTYYDAIEPYGFFILLAMIFTGILNKILVGPIFFILKSIYWLFGL